MNHPVFVLKLKSLRGNDIHGLRAILKRLLRQYGFRCLSAYEEQIPKFPHERD